MPKKDDSPVLRVPDSNDMPPINPPVPSATLEDHKLGWYYFFPNGIDQSLPLIYEWRLVCGCSYIGQTTEFLTRGPRYVFRVGQMLAGLPYDANNPNRDFRHIHRLLYAAIGSYDPHITLTLLQNATTEEQLTDRENAFIAARGCLTGRFHNDEGTVCPCLVHQHQPLPVG